MAWDGRLVGAAARLTKPLTCPVNCRPIHDPDRYRRYLARMMPDEAPVFRHYGNRAENAAPDVLVAHDGDSRGGRSRSGGPARLGGALPVNMDVEGFRHINRVFSRIASLEFPISTAIFISASPLSLVPARNRG